MATRLVVFHTHSPNLKSLHRDSNWVQSHTQEPLTEFSPVPRSHGLIITFLSQGCVPGQLLVWGRQQECMLEAQGRE